MESPVVSANGDFVAGYRRTANAQLQVVRWSAGTIVAMDQPRTNGPTVLAISNDGQAAYGNGEYGTDAVGRPFVGPVCWRFGVANPLVQSEVMSACAPEAGVAVGVHGSMWFDNVCVPLAAMAPTNGITGASATDVSSDGGVVVGSGLLGGQPVLWRWTLGQGMVAIPGANGGRAHVSGNGQVVYWTGGGSSSSLMRWTEQGGTTEVYAPISTVMAVSGDGRTVAVTVLPSPTLVVWTEEGGGRPIAHVLGVEAGLNIRGWTGLVVRDINQDGRVFVGMGHSPCGPYTAWAARSADARLCPGDFNGSGVVSVQDLFSFLAAYFGGDPGADWNGTCSLTVQDIFDFLAAYFAGCV